MNETPPNIEKVIPDLIETALGEMKNRQQIEWGQAAEATNAARNFLKTIDIDIQKPGEVADTIRVDEDHAVLLWKERDETEPPGPIVMLNVGKLREQNKFVALIGRDVGKRLYQTSLRPEPGLSMMGRIEFQTEGERIKTEELELILPLTNERATVNDCLITINRESGLVSSISLQKEGVQILDVSDAVLDTGQPHYLQYEVKPDSKSFNDVLGLITDRLGIDSETFRKPIDVDATMKQMLISNDFTPTKEGYLPPPIVHKTPVTAAT